MNNFFKNISDYFKKSDTTQSSTKKNKDILAKVCCVFFAVILWLVVVSQADDLEQERTFYAIPVTISNANLLMEESGLSIVNKPDYITNITVKGSRAKLPKFSSEDIIASIDVKDIKEAGEHEVMVNVTCPPSSGFTVVSQSIDSVKLTVDTVSSKTFDIKVNISNAQYDANKYALGQPTVTPSKVTVSGPQKVLDTISCACVNLNLGTVNSTIGYNRPILLLDSSNEEIDSTYLQLSNLYADGEVPLISIEEASKITTKTVELTTDFEYGFYNKENCSVSIFPKTVNLRGRDVDLSKISSLNVLTIDETVYTSNTVVDVDLQLPNGITLVDDVDKVTVTIVISEDISMSEITVEKVDFIGNTDGKNIELTSPFVLKFRGDITLLEQLKLKQDAFTVSINVSNIFESGTYMLPCVVKLSADFNDIWCDYTQVSVHIQ